MKYFVYQRQLRWIMFKFIIYCRLRGRISSIQYIPEAYLELNQIPKAYVKLRIELHNGCSFEQEIDFDGEKIIPNCIEMY